VAGARGGSTKGYVYIEKERKRRERKKEEA
jgi:hypothetical protein